MKLTRQSAADRQLIQRYGNGGFRVSNVDFTGAVIVTPEHTVSWAATSVADLTPADFAPLMNQSLDVCLLGCGKEMLPLKPELRAALKEAGITVDLMDTGAACRTYNVLMGEGRAVAAALIAI